MKIENQRIVEATERELFDNWLLHELYEIMTFEHYINALKQLGVTITGEPE